MALVEKRIAKVTVTAHTDCKLYHLRETDFSNLRKHQEGIRTAVDSMEKLRNSKWEDVIDQSIKKQDGC